MVGLKKIQKDIGIKLKDLRLAKGLSQEELYFHTKISRDHISNIENGKRPVNVKTLYKFAKFFKVDIIYFFQK